MARMLEDAGIHAFRIHVALYETYQYVVPPASVPRGVHAPLGKAIRESVREAKVMLGHRINDPVLAEELLQRGAADVILMGRPLIADPEFCMKVAQGRYEEIRKCIGCNIGCVGNIVSGLPATCTVNPAVGKEREFEVVPARAAKEVVVVGGGVGGMEAARVAALRGHRVTLYEKEARLGGWAAVGCIPPHKEEIKDLVAYYATQMQRRKVDVHLGKEVTSEEILQRRPDAVILAVGSGEIVPAIPGVERTNVVIASDVLTGKSETGGKVLIIGGGQTGLETAEFLAQEGRKVTVLEMLPEVGRDMELITKVFMMPRLAQAGIAIRTNARVEEILEEGVRVDGESIEADTVVVAVGLRAGTSLADSLLGKVQAVFEIGDCVKPRRLLDAIHEGARAARSI